MTQHACAPGEPHNNVYQSNGICVGLVTPSEVHYCGFSLMSVEWESTIQYDTLLCGVLIQVGH